MGSRKDSFVETVGVVLGLMGLTALMVGTIAFPIAKTWKNSFSITFLPAGAVLLAGSAFIKWRLASILLLPAGAVGLAITLMGWGKASEEAARLPYLLPTIIASLLMLASLAINVPAMIRGTSQRRGLVGANVFLMCLMGMVLLVAGNYLASRYYTKRDLTKTGTFTLSQRTADYVKSLDEPVTVTVIMSQTSGVTDEFDYACYGFAQNMLDSYATVSKGKLTVEYIDPISERQKALTFFNDLGGGEREQSIVFTSDQGFHQIPRRSLLDQDPMARFRGYAQSEPKFQGETVFTAALMKVTDKKRSTIYFTTGKGEKSLESGQNAMTYIAKRIREDNYDTKTINLAAQPLPDDCDILAIVGPRRPFSQPELDQIAKYLDNPAKPGKLFVALDPLVERVQESGLESILQERGLTVRQDVTAINPEDSLMAALIDPLTVYSTHTRHEITEKMEGLSTVFRVSCMIEPQKAPQGPQGQPVPMPYESEALALADKGWGEVNLSGERVKYDAGTDVAGPVPIAAASKKRDPNQPPPNPYMPSPPADPSFDGARIVATGDSDFLTDSMMQQGPGNVDFALNCINWLARKTNRLGIAAKPLFAEPISIKPGEGEAIFYGTLIGLPYLALVVGGIVYWRRTL